MHVPSESAAKSHHTSGPVRASLEQAAAWASGLEGAPGVGGNLNAVDEIAGADPELRDVLSVLKHESVASHVACEVAADVVAHLEHSASEPVCHLVSKDQPGIVVDLQATHLRGLAERLKHFWQVGKPVGVRVNTAQVVGLFD